jgi:hypothetical protein
VLIKPICDSHRVDELLALPTGMPGRALWMWRDVDDRARSEVAKFGPANLTALRAIADGTIGDRWQGQRLAPETVALIRSFDLAAMDPHTGAALFWFVRNDLYFRLGLSERDDVLLVAYQDMVDAPEAAARRVCTFLDLPYRPEFAADVAAVPSKGPLPIDARVRELCDELTVRLAKSGAVSRG